MAKLKWDQTGQKFFEMGASKAVLFPYSKEKSGYGDGVAWSGLIKVNENPEGAEVTKLWADNVEYAAFRSNEEFNGSIDAYTYPPEFDECNGYKEAAPGMKLSQQPRTAFAFSYRTAIGSDTDPDCSEYKLHLVYNATASPSAKEYNTINDSPDAITFSWDFETTPIDPEIEGFKPTAHIEIDSRKANKEQLKALEEIIYGSDAKESRLPMPKEMAELLKNSSPAESQTSTVSTASTAPANIQANTTSTTSVDTVKSK